MLSSPAQHKRMTTTTGTIGTILHHKGATVWTISPQATVFEAIQLLAWKNIGALPVLEGGKLIGIFSGARLHAKSCA